VYDFKGVQAVMLFRAHRYDPDSPELQGQHLDGSRYEDFNRELGLEK